VGRFIQSIAFSLPLRLRADQLCYLSYDEAFGGKAHGGGSPKISKEQVSGISGIGEAGWGWLHREQAREPLAVPTGRTDASASDLARDFDSLLAEEPSCRSLSPGKLTRRTHHQDRRCRGWLDRFVAGDIKVSSAARDDPIGIIA